LGVSLSGLLDSALAAPLGRSLTIGSTLLAPIFSRGRLTSELEFASAAQVETVEQYRLAILRALKEAEDARSAIARSGERASLLREIVTEAGTTARLANLQYIEGEEDLLNVLDAQQLLNQAENAAVLATQEQLFARIALYRAAGGFHAGPLTQAPNPRLAF
jgi:outer membrane protein TolC